MTWCSETETCARYYVTVKSDVLMGGIMITRGFIVRKHIRQQHGGMDVVPTSSLHSTLLYWRQKRQVFPKWWNCTNLTGCKRKRLNLHIIWANQTGKHCHSIERYHVYVLSSKAYSGERAWKFIGDRLQQPNYLSRIDHDWKIRNRRQRTDIGKYSFVNRTIRLWNRLPAEILRTLPCKLHAFRKRVRRVINGVNWRENEWVVTV
jgi:hypothetical protein